MYTYRKTSVVLFLTFLCAVLPVITYARSTETRTLIAPSNMVNSEGDHGENPEFYDIPFRVQILGPAYHFAELSKQPWLITHVSWRPNAGPYWPVTSPRTATFGDFQLRLSTTEREAGELSKIFAENVGLDETVVFDGPVTIHTENLGPLEGPRQFDYTVEFQTPFLYDPNEGNLLFECISQSGMNVNPMRDCQTEPAGEIFLAAYAADATEATEWSDITMVTKLTLVEPCMHLLIGDLNDDCEVNLEDLSILGNNWLKDCFANPDDPACVPK